MIKIQATMNLDRVTKGAVLYKNIKQNVIEAITNLYLRKSGLDPAPYPEVIHVTVEIEGLKDDN